MHFNKQVKRATKALHRQTGDNSNGRHLVVGSVNFQASPNDGFGINADKKRQVAVFKRKLLPLHYIYKYISMNLSPCLDLWIHVHI
ncbi:hypothetical protein ST44_02385 [Prevotella pectinovora]|uniref:Uncharacterized protein n=1 Tax=Prevotella pectinovora TaxID=1602169 RepID=A0A0D0IXX5_9BACT|nr:hypothetical protein ST44_02385 [Prevotella pectinovora]